MPLRACARWRSRRRAQSSPPGSRSWRATARASSTSSPTPGAARQGHGARAWCAGLLRARAGTRRPPRLPAGAAATTSRRGASTASSASRSAILYWYRGTRGRAALTEDDVTGLARAARARVQAPRRDGRHRGVVHRRRRGRGDHAHLRQREVVRPRVRHLHEPRQAADARRHARDARGARRGERGGGARDGRGARCAQPAPTSSVAVTGIAGPTAARRPASRSGLVWFAWAARGRPGPGALLPLRRATGWTVRIAVR